MESTNSIYDVNQFRCFEKQKANNYALSDYTPRLFGENTNHRQKWLAKHGKHFRAIGQLIKLDLINSLLPFTTAWAK